MTIIITNKKNFHLYFIIGLSIGAVAGIAATGTLLVTLPVCSAISLCVTLRVWKREKEPTSEDAQQKMEENLYNKPPETDISPREL